MRDLKSYVQRHPLIWVTFFLYSCLCHGAMLLSPSSGIDVDVAINGTANNGLDIGRQGFFLLHYALGNGWFNMYYAGALTLLFLAVAALLWSYLYVQASGVERASAIVFSGLLFLSGSTLTMQLFFKSQAVETAFAFCLMPVTLLLVMKSLEHDAPKTMLRHLTLLLIPTVILFSTYQVFYVIFIFGVVAYLFLRFHNREFMEQFDAKKRWGIALWSGGFFVVAFLVNRIITNIIVEDEAYLTNQIQWGQESLKTILWLIGKSIVGCLIGYQPYFTWTLLVFYVMTVVVCVRLALAEKTIASRILILLVTLGLLLSHFGITIIMGMAPALRSQLVYPLLIGFFGFYVFSYFGERKVIPLVLQLCCVICLFSQFGATQRLNYTDAKRYERDVQIASAIQLELTEVGADESTPIAFYGHIPTSLNSACMIVSEPLYHSIFDWDWFLEPQYSFSSTRMVDFLNTQGCNYQAADAEAFESVVPEIAKEMPSFPAEGSVIKQDGLVIIKLNEE